MYEGLWPPGISIPLPREPRDIVLADRAEDSSEIGTAQLTRLLSTDRRGDADVRSDVLRALMLDSLVPMTVDAQVQDGVVTLAGTVTWHSEREDAKFLAGCVPGVLGVLDEIRLVSALDRDDGDADIAADTAAAIEETELVDVADLTVDTAGHGAVVLSGAVRSWTEHEHAIEAAWTVPGVVSVEDCLAVED